MRNIEEATNFNEMNYCMTIVYLNQTGVLYQNKLNVGKSIVRNYKWEKCKDYAFKMYYETRQ
jgi:hypothetical protein